MEFGRHGEPGAPRSGVVSSCRCRMQGGDQDTAGRRACILFLRCRQARRQPQLLLHAGVTAAAPPPTCPPLPLPPPPRPPLATPRSARPPRLARRAPPPQAMQTACAATAFTAWSAGPASNLMATSRCASPPHAAGRAGASALPRRRCHAAAQRVPPMQLTRYMAATPAAPQCQPWNFATVNGCRQLSKNAQCAACTPGAPAPRPACRTACRLPAPAAARACPRPRLPARLQPPRPARPAADGACTRCSLAGQILVRARRCLLS